LGKYTQSAAKGFEENGIEALCIAYPPDQGLLDRAAWFYLPKLRLTAVKRTRLAQIDRRVREACEKASLLIIIKSDQFPLAQYMELLDSIKCCKVLWLMDSIHRVEQGLERASMADAVFFFEGTDRSALSLLNVPHFQVALAADPDLYYPTEIEGYQWDVSFVGQLYDNRLDTLESVLAELPSDSNIKMHFVGSYRSFWHPRRARRRVKRYSLTSPHLKHGSYWSHAQINTLNNFSRICLNILHPQSKDSLNMRAFETCCSGAFLLCQDNEALGDSFVIGREVEAFRTPQEAAAKITYYLQHDGAARKIALAGRERVLSEHTMKTRTQQMLAILENEGLL